MIFIDIFPFSVFQFTYKADSNQMRFLQLLSAEAWQQLTYHCKNSVAVFDATRRNLRSALQIMTAADTELKARGNRKFRYRVVEDGCRVSSIDEQLFRLSSCHSSKFVFLFLSLYC